MNVAMLGTLTAILERGSFAAAAQAVGCTPSAVSLQVKQLESYFGRPLFDRSGRSVQPTAFARELGALARELGGRLDALRVRPTFKVAGRVRLGAIASVQADVLPPALRALRDRHPELAVQVSLADSAALQAAVSAGHLDAAVLVRPAAGGSGRLLWQDLARQPFVMLAPADAPRAGAAALLRHCGWICYDRALTGGRLAARSARRLAPQATPVMELRSLDAIVAMVAAGLGASIVPRPRQPLLDAYAVREVPLGRHGPTRQIALVRRHADAEHRNIDAVWQALRSACAQPPASR